MPKATKVVEDEYRLPAQTLFPARLDKVTERKIEFVYKQDHPRVKAGRAVAGEVGEFVKWEWEFAILDGPYSGERAYGDTPDKLTNREDNLVRQWAETLLGREIALGEEFDTDMIIGLPCLITCRHDDPRKRQDGTNFYPCPVEDVLPTEEDFVPF